MKPKSRKLALNYIRLHNNYLNSHSRSVGDGKTLSETMFCTLTGITYVPTATLATMPCADQLKYARRKSNRMSRVNRVLATRGLQLRSKNNYTTFTFTTDTDRTIRRNETLAINAGIRNGVLMAGSAAHRGKWSSLTKAEAGSLAYGYK